VQANDLALARQEVVLDVETLHGLQMSSQHGSRDEVGDLRGLIAARLERVQRVEAYLLASRQRLRSRHRRIVRPGPCIPLAHPSIEVPAVVVDALAARSQLGQQLTRCSQRPAFKMHQPHHHIRDLHAGVVDVVLHAYLIAGLVRIRAQ
jgi:hypothetical protein